MRPILQQPHKPNLGESAGTSTGAWMPEFLVESEAHKPGAGGDRSVYRGIEVVRIDERIPAHGQPGCLSCEDESFFVGRGLL